MLPLSLRETSEEAAQRQANFICLRFLEDKVPKTLFDEVVKTVISFLSQFQQVSDQLELPKRIDWKGESRPLNFEEVKLNFSQIDQNFITRILQNQTVGPSSTSHKKDAFSNHKIQYQPISKLISGEHKNLFLNQKSLHLQNLAADQKRNLKNYQISRYQRVKTVFGHAQIEEAYQAPIYSVLFDQTGNFIISGADDGIIKIWDKETMNLQGSLHSHNDVITDMDISKCNRFLATSSKDGKLIIWDWKNCVKLDEIAAHDSTINNIKFFQLKIKNQNQQSKESQKIQILATCSEDGTIKIYDEVGFLNNVIQPGNEQAQKRTRRNDQNANKKERYFQCLTPDDFRPVQGNRNKKIDSVNINQNGLVAAGTSSGEIFMWRLDIVKFRQQHSKAFTWLGTSKKHLKTVHFCEFSPNGRYLFTGSVDGTAKIWNIEQEKSKKSNDQLIALTDNRLVATMEEKRIFGSKDKHIFFQNVRFQFFIKLQRHGDQVSMAEHRQQKSNWQCDCIAWSVHGRYAICALSGKIDLDNQMQDQSFIKIWDSHTNTIIEDIGEKNGLKLMNFTFVLAPHPKIEEIFLSGSDGGLICLWDIKQRKLIKSFKEYGVYTSEKYTMNDPFDGKFSPDGSCFIVGSEMGTISLFSNEGAPYKYYATRVEQFYPQDDKKHIANIYYDQNEEPQVCSYSLIPYEVQPTSSLIGKFRNRRQLTHEEYERNYIIRLELGLEEEQFNQSQIDEGLRNDIFNNNEDNLHILTGQNPDIQALRGRLNSQLSQISNSDNNAIMPSQEDVEMLDNFNRLAPQNRRRGRRRNPNDHGRQQRALSNQNRQQIQNQQNIRINTNLDPDNSFYDRDSDENFEIEEAVESEEEEYGNEESEDYHVSRNERENYHQRMLTRRENQNGNNNANRQNRRGPGRPPQNQVQQESRSQRLQRRNQRTNHLEEEKDDIQVQGRRKRRRAVIRSDDSSQVDISEDQDYDMSDNNDNIKPRRKLKKLNLREESEEEDDVSDMEENIDDSDDQNISGMRTRNARKGSKQPKKSNQTDKRGNSRRNLRSRENRKRCDGMDSSEDDFMDYEEEKQAKYNDDDEQKPGSQGKKQSNRVIKEESDSDAVDQDVIVPTDISKKQKGDEDYDYQPNHPMNQIQLEEQMILQRKCELCKRSDGPIIGPFIKVIKQKQNESPLFFHKDCIEVSSISFFNRQKQKWMNIGKALEVFSKRPHMCRRCNAIGATIKCQSCDKTYHGYLCSQLYMIYTGGDSYQCFDCRNRENYHQFVGKELLEKSEFKILKRQMSRDFQLMTKQPRDFYMPQINDQVYYFFQGHEKFISQYNCFFYAGNEKQLSFQYPWTQYLELEKPTLCRIQNISYSFPSKNVLYLLKRYGKSSNIVQEPQIIMHLELQIIGQPEKIFDIDYFPNQLSEFLVLKRLYENSLYFYHALMQQQNFIGQTFKTRLKNFNKIKVVSVQEREQLLEETGWESIQFRHVESYGLRERGRRGQRRQSMDEESQENMNFWEIILSQEFEDNQEYQGLVSAFEDDEIQRIIGIIQEYVERKKEQTAPFMDRVPEKIAPDYRQHVSAEMYMNLVLERLLNKYYRTQEQLFSDLDLISYNARIYNGEDNVLYKDAKKMVEALRCEIKKNINYSDDIKQQRIEESKGLIFSQKPIGKLTAPIMRSNGHNQLTSMDQFKMQIKQQEKDEEMKNDYSINSNNHITIQQQLPSRLTRRNRDIQDGMQTQQNNINQVPVIQNNLIDIKNQDLSDHSEMKITPNAKIVINTHIQSNDSSSVSRRQNKNQIANQRDFDATYDGNNGNQFDTGEKIILKTNYQADENADQGLGKRTRSGRQTRQVKTNLNEDEADKEFENMISGGPINSKRIRQN